MLFELFCIEKDEIIDEETGETLYELSSDDISLISMEKVDDRIDQFIETIKDIRLIGLKVT